jgi:hypothetical protein
MLRACFQFSGSVSGSESSANSLPNLSCCIAHGSRNVSGENFRAFESSLAISCTSRRYASANCRASRCSCLLVFELRIIVRMCLCSSSNEPGLAAPPIRATPSGQIFKQEIPVFVRQNKNRTTRRRLPPHPAQEEPPPQTFPPP